MALFNKSLDHLASKTDLELVRQEMATLRAEVKAAQLTYAELADKVTHMLHRIGKRVRDAQKDEPPTPVPDDLPEVDEVTAKILARRRARGVSA